MHYDQISLISHLGARVEEFFAHVGRITILFSQAVFFVFKPPYRIRLIVEQMNQVGVQSLPIVLLTATFTGMVLVLQTAVGLERYGAEIQASGIAAVAFAREMGPVLTSVMLAGRVGAGIAAEVGTMKVTEQIDALRTLATNPIHYLVVPRLVAATIMVPVLTVLADVIGLGGGYLVGVYNIGISPKMYLSTTREWLLLPDLASGVFKTPFFGMIIATIACYQGFQATGGAEGVGKATTKAVVMGAILILISNYFLTDLALEYSDPVLRWLEGLIL